MPLVCVPGVMVCCWPCTWCRDETKLLSCPGGHPSAAGPSCQQRHVEHAITPEGARYERQARSSEWSGQHRLCGCAHKFCCDSCAPGSHYEQHGISNLCSTGEYYQYNVHYYARAFRGRRQHDEHEQCRVLGGPPLPRLARLHEGRGQGMTGSSTSASLSRAVRWQALSVRPSAAEEDARCRRCRAVGLAKAS